VRCRSETCVQFGGKEFLSVVWIRRLLEAFVICQEEFRVMVVEFHERR
jgi:hypothetical protein